MRLNRILQLAAGFSILIFAMVFTITSCSGDDGKNGKNGADGKSCFADPMPDGSGYNLYCGGRTEDDFVGPIYHGVGEGGVAPGQAVCVFTTEQVSGSAYTIKCGETKIPIYGPSSPGGSVGGGCTVAQADQYNPFYLKVTCGTTTMDVCLNGGVFDPDNYVCTNGAKRTVDINRDYYNRGGYYTDIILDNGSTPDQIAGTGTANVGVGKENAFPSITAGIILPKSAFRCNELLGSVSTGNTLTDVYYDPNKQFCYSNNAPAYTGSPYKLKDLCGANDFEATRKFCFESKTGYKVVVSLCGGVGGIGGASFLYNQFCQTERTQISGSDYGVITGFARYNATPSKVMPLCGSNDWTGKITVDANSEILDYNAGKYYNNWASTNATPGTIEEYGFAYALTGPTNGFDASKGTIGGGQQICDTDGIVKTKCGIPTAGSGSSATWVENKILYFDARSQFCRDDVQYTGSATYTQKVEVQDLCRQTGVVPQYGIGGLTYDSKDYFCDVTDGKVKKKCLDAFYDETTQFCYKEGATAIGVGNKCRVNPAATGSSISYLPAQYDPRKQFCTVKISGVASQSGSCADLNKSQWLNGSSTGSAGTVGSSTWGTTAPTQQYTPYATNSFPACYNKGDISLTTTNVGAGTYAYEEVPEDMCKGSIKYNQGSWLWQSCLVTDKTDRTKDLYQHCGEGERPKADFTGCEEIAERNAPGACLATQVKDWDGNCLTPAGASPNVSDCSGTVSGATLGGTNSNECRCPAGYTINSTTTPTNCRIASAAASEWCNYNAQTAPGLLADGTGCVATCSGTGYVSAAGVCTCATNYNWFGANSVSANVNECLTPSDADHVFTSSGNSTQIFASKALAFASITTDGGTADYCNGTSANGICAGTKVTCTVTTVSSATDCD